MKPVKRGDGRYHLRIQRNGVQRTFFDKTAKGCIEQARRWDGKPSANTTCEIAIKNWIETHISTKSNSSYEQYSFVARKYVLPVIGKILVGKILPLNCQNVINNMKRDGLAESTMKHAKKVMHSFFEYERKFKRTISFNPCVDLEIPKVKNTRERKSATPEELRLVWKILDGTHYFWCYQFLFMTGLRPSEICGIKIKDIKGDIIKISEARTRRDISSGKTMNANREIRISTGMQDIINMQLNYLKSTYRIMPEYLFPNKTGEPSHAGLLTQHWCRNMSGKVDLTMYELRHTFISLMIDRMPLKELQAFIGHSSRMDTPTTYAHIFKKAQSNVDIIDETMLQYLHPEEKSKIVKISH